MLLHPHPMRKYITHIKDLGNFLLRYFNREFLIFVFFLLLSSMFWLVLTLNQNYDKEIHIPIKIVNIPQNVVITQNINDTLDVTVRDKGFALLAYTYGGRLQPIMVDFNKYANKATGQGKILVSDLHRSLYAILYGSSKITAIKTDQLTFYFNYGQAKRVPIKLLGTIEAAKSYYIAQIKFSPNYVTIYANKHLLDSIHWLTTTPLTIKNVGDTIMQTIDVQRIRGVKIVPERIKMSIYPDILTEESIEVPITAINMPTGKVLRTFPSKVKVNFTIGVSRFRKLRADQFIVTADYEDIMAHPAEKCNIRIKKYPTDVARPTLEIQQVDYLIEQQ